MPCVYKLAAIIPDDFQLPPEIVERIRQLGLKESWMREDAWRDGIDSVCYILKKYEELREKEKNRDSIYEQWSSRLQEFATECRIANPRPRFDMLSEKEKAKTEIIAERIRQTNFTPDETWKFLRICRLPLFAIPTAEQLIAPMDTECVFLTPEEVDAWDAIISTDDDDLGLTVWYSYEMEDPLQEDGVWRIFDETLPDRPAGTEIWLFWGHSDKPPVEVCLWSWNGAQANYIGSRSLDFG